MTVYAPLVSAQHLMADEVWLKMKASVKGHLIDSPNLPITSYSNAGTFYVRFSPAANAFQHEWELWSFEQTLQTWEVSASGTQYIYGERDGIIMEWSPRWYVGFLPFEATVNGFMRIKRDGLGTKSAKFTTDGCIATGGTAGGTLYGGCKITGSLIKPEKLPFTYP